ncbi:uncharacterized protein LOC144110178 isoform X2 [Amblyomma americanum]
MNYHNIWQNHSPEVMALQREYRSKNGIHMIYNAERRVNHRTETSSVKPFKNYFAQYLVRFTEDIKTFNTCIGSFKPVCIEVGYRQVENHHYYLDRLLHSGWKHTKSDIRAAPEKYETVWFGTSVESGQIAKLNWKSCDLYALYCGAFIVIKCTYRQRKTPFNGLSFMLGNVNGSTQKVEFPNFTSTSKEYVIQVAVGETTYTVSSKEGTKIYHNNSLSNSLKRTYFDFDYNISLLNVHMENVQGNQSSRAIMTSYGPLANIPDDIFQKRIAVMGLNGFHVNYPHGRTLSQPISHVLRDPYYNGQAFRVFFYAPQTSTTNETIVRLALNKAENSDKFVQFVLRGDNVNYQGADVDGLQDEKPFIRPGTNPDQPLKFQTPGFYTAAIELDGRRMRAIFNTYTSEYFTMPIRHANEKWHFYINAGHHTIMSVHASEEQVGNLPSRKLGSQYFLQNLPLSVGSFAVYTLIFTGGALFAFRFQQSGGHIERAFYNISLKRGQIVTVYVRNGPTSWLVHANFVNIVYVVAGRDYRDLIAPQFDHAVIIRAYCECGPEVS